VATPPYGNAMIKIERPTLETFLEVNGKCKVRLLTKDHYKTFLDALEAAEKFSETGLPFYAQSCGGVVPWIATDSKTSIWAVWVEPETCLPEFIVFRGWTRKLKFKSGRYLGERQYIRDWEKHIKKYKTRNDCEVID
jgi:hypothetical protein